jgi:signal transduction histidine kinase
VTPATFEILRSAIRTEHDVFVVRQRGREVAALLGLEQQDQVRVATSLSEVGRLLLAGAAGADVAITVKLHPQRSLCIAVMGRATITEDAFATMRVTLSPLAALMDSVEVSLDEESRIMVDMHRALPAGGTPVTQQSIDEARAALAASGPTTVLDELTVQNQQLLSALDEVQRQRDELLRLNAELEETNRGVMALYTQLSQELEETNRGVVALYAELEERSAQLRDASTAKSRFLRNVSHELRAPVTAIMGLARLLTDPGSDPLTEEQHGQVDLLSSSAADLLSLVNELLDLSKAESGRLEPRWSEVDLHDLFGQLRGTLRALIARPEVSLRVDEPAEVPVLTTDESMLTQVLRNLITNGLKFTERGEVRLTATLGDEPGTARLEVSDTGIGIAADDQERVFEEFYQVPSPQQAKVRGTGLGLPYARRLVTLLGGALTVRSTPGEGSAFTITLPVRPADQAPADEPPADPADAPGPAVLHRVLVVDDDAAFRMLARRALRGVADEVEEADDGLRALTLITRQRPDAVLLDLRMPEVDGLAVLEVLAADEALRAIPVVVVTAEPTGEPGTALAHAATVLGKADLTPEGLAAAVRAVAKADR